MAQKQGQTFDKGLQIFIYTLTQFLLGLSVRSFCFAKYERTPISKVTHWKSTFTYCSLPVQYLQDALSSSSSSSSSRDRPAPDDSICKYHSSRYDVTAVPTEYCKLFTDRVYRKGQSQEIIPYVMTRLEDAAQPPKLGKLNYKIYYKLGLVFALKMASSFINLQRLNKEWLIKKNNYNVSSNWDDKFANRKEGMCLITSVTSNSLGVRTCVVELLLGSKHHAHGSKANTSIRPPVKRLYVLLN